MNAVRAVTVNNEDVLEFAERNVADGCTTVFKWVYVCGCVCVSRRPSGGIRNASHGHFYRLMFRPPPPPRSLSYSSSSLKIRLVSAKMFLFFLGEISDF